MAASRSIELGRRIPVRCWDSAMLVCTVGIAGLVHDSWPTPAFAPWINLHALFGLLLWIMVVAQFEQGARSTSGPQQVNYQVFCRQLSRVVYILLYSVFGANQLIRCGVILWNRESIGALHPAILQPPENLRDYLVCGIIALLIIHACTALHRHMPKRGRLVSTFPNY